MDTEQGAEKRRVTRMTSHASRLSGQDSSVFGLSYSTTPALVPARESSSNEPRRRQSFVPASQNTAPCDDDIIAALEEEEPLPAVRRRNSAFLEVGLGGDDAIVDAKLSDTTTTTTRPRLQVRFRSTVDVFEPDPPLSTRDESFPPAPTARDKPPQMPFAFPTLSRLLFLALVAVLVTQSLHTTPILKADANPVGPRRDGLLARDTPRQDKRALPGANVKRDNSPTVVCKRWAGQSALVNGTLYYYGGRSTTSGDQTANEWNNDLVAIDLTKSWQISTPSISGLPIPSGPPAVSLGYLWNSYDALYLYGGEFSDSPAESPVPFSTWSYDVSSSSWTELSNPKTSAGDNSEPAGQPVQRAAEGAGVSVPNIGRGFYFGGHLDGYTTPGWSQSVARVYIKGLLEYTFPGYTNDAVSDSGTAGSSGIYRNITEGGVQDTSGFPERADGVLVYVPGYSKQGIIIGLAGGTNATFTQMNVIDVYDIAASKWYKQATSGPTPDIRVNPCAVAVSAADGTSTQVHMYGGQNLVPYGDQIQYDDMWILTVPSFTWIKVDTSDQATPGPRAGHTCNVWNAQMVVVGGYVGQDQGCDSPGVYVFNTSSLSWQNEYVALDSRDDLNRQESQRDDAAALQGSYGYAVPPAVQRVVGGNAVGAATVTQPAQTATQGPLMTGQPLTYSVTGAPGASGTSSPTSGGGSDGSGNGSDSSSGGGGGATNVGAIVAGVIAGLFAVLAAYLGFCVWLYRKQLRIYKNHSDMAQRQHLSGDPRYIGAGAGGSAAASEGVAAQKYTDKSQTDSRNSADNHSGDGSTTGARSTSARANQLNSNNPYRNVAGGAGSATAASSTEDLMAGQEPSFLGVVLNPRRSLRVVNRD
ncbi:hypothetical protein PV08_03204 [Exophiala spinifera]|uniref:Kelch repeat-containing protein n=1 Tax=Exophiala spinifera TaxID=91928 RepID=A0A0D2BK09_9EURO|nr:uncharacterized protein PV08_03204 [Exophiala spinifera]KIW18915.1 hypothetical protein PV08_03204 [Exophiala spinifera]